LNATPCSIGEYIEGNERDRRPVDAEAATARRLSVSSAKWWCDWPRPTQPQSLGDTPEAVVQHLALDAEQGEVTTDVMGGCAPIM
jgi:hypothetical protein